MKQIQKQLLFCLIVGGSFLMWQKAEAANHYITSNGSGIGDSWSDSMALPTESSWIRGDTYYIATGNYVGFTVTTAGSSVITIKKATASEHGTDNGWQEAYGTGQAVFQYDSGDTTTKKTTINISQPYVILDGMVGNEMDENSYGFRVKAPADFGQNRNSSGGIQGVYVYYAGNVRVSHVAAEGAGYKACYGHMSVTGLDFNCANNGITQKSSANDRVSEVEISHNYSYNWQNNITFVGAINSSIHDNYTSHNQSDTGYLHGQSIDINGTDDCSVYNNYVYKSQTFAISMHSHWTLSALGYGNIGAKFYNNIVDGSEPAYTNGVRIETNQLSMCIGYGTSEVDGIWSSYFHHNTIANVNCGGYGFAYVGTLSDIANKSYAYNNLFYNVAHPRMDNGGRTVGAIIHDNNAYLSCTGTINSSDELASQVGNEDPFVDSANGDYRLKIGTLPINNGKTDLGATYANDFLGNPRGASPDIGAYEYVGTSDTVAPAAPSGLAVT